MASAQGAPKGRTFALVLGRVGLGGHSLLPGAVGPGRPTSHDREVQQNFSKTLRVERKIGYLLLVRWKILLLLDSHTTFSKKNRCFETTTKKELDQ
jgi:hypothetical protein